MNICRKGFGIILTLLLPVLFSETVTGQVFNAEKFPQSWGYGLAGGFTVSGFTGDSAGYNGIAMPYGGFFMTVDLNNRFTMTANVSYLVKGINRQSPYERYRYNFYGGDVAAHVRVVDFLQLGGGYRYGFENSSKMIVLDGSSASGVERSAVSGFGNYGQFTAEAVLFFNPSTSLVLSYGVPGKTTPMTHFQAGVRIDLEKRVKAIDQSKIDKDNRRAQLQASMLNDGILLVRLKSMRSSIVALEENGFVKEAQKLREATALENREVTTAFSKYTFSRVLFFYDYNSNLVREGNFNTILFDGNLNPVILDTLPEFIFTAELGQYTSPERSYHVKHDYQYLKEHNIHPDSSAAWVTYGDKGLGIGGIVIMDQQFEPLLKPFPVFTPVHNPLLFRKGNRVERAILKLNDELLKLLFSGR